MDETSQQAAPTCVDPRARTKAFELHSGAIGARQPLSIVTRMRFDASIERAWHGLMFYEQIGERPPLHLRLLLPVPIRTESAKTNVGDEVRCLYEGGHLLKRITRIDAGRRYEFEVVEQNLAVGRGMSLAGGCYTFQELAGGGIEVAVTTRYVSPRRPGWLWRPLEAAVCHMFHRHLLAAMRRKVESA